MKGKKTGVLLLTVLIAVGGLFVWKDYSGSEFYTGIQQAEPDTKTMPEENGTKSYSSSLVGNLDSLNEEQREILRQFVSKYARTLSELEPQDFSCLFSDTAGKNYHQHVAAYRILCEIRKMSHMDLEPTDVTVTYNIQEVQDWGNSIKVYITEDNTQKFKHMDRPSCSYNLNHEFTMVNSDDGWKIKDHQHEEDFFLLAQQAWDNAKGATNSEKTENTINILIADARENKESLKISTGNPPQDIKVTNTDYDRRRAVAYAKEWCNKRNYNGVYLAYDMYGGNCQNFASQCIHAGGIAMDYKGYAECQWKFYSQTQNNKQTASGRSYSWTGVDPFYTYATLNRTSGLICQADLALEYAQPGDVIQVGAYYEWRHSLVVTDVMFDDEGNLQDIIVASNTADRWNYPLSAYIYTYPRLIHILGQV